MFDPVIELVEKYIVKTEDDKFHFSSKMYTDPDFLRKLEEASPKMFDAYCTICRFKEFEPSRGALFDMEEDLINNFIEVLFEQKKEIVSENVLQIVLICLVLIISAIVLFYAGYYSNYTD